MKNPDKFELLLKKALSPIAEPSEELNSRIINSCKTLTVVNPTYRKKASVALVAALFTIITSLTVFAAWNFLTPKQVAQQLKDNSLAHAFSDKNAIEINESVSSGGYNFSLQGIVSGKNLSDFRSSASDINPDRTYAVVSINKQDGSEMPGIQDADYGKVRFFISPLIKGQKPWKVNITAMNGGYSEFVKDGVMYRLIECDGIEMFADRGLYLCICSGNLYDDTAFNYDEKSGEVSVNKNYKGVNVLFNLPLDIEKADHSKAEEYLKQLLKEPVQTTASNKKNILDCVKNAVVIPDSYKRLTCDKDGYIYYEYGRARKKILAEGLFKKDEVGIYKTSSIFGLGEGSIAVQFMKDANGVITGRALKLINSEEYLLPEEVLRLYIDYLLKGDAKLVNSLLSKRFLSTINNGKGYDSIRPQGFSSLEIKKDSSKEQTDSKTNFILSFVLASQSEPPFFKQKEGESVYFVELVYGDNGWKIDRMEMNP